MVDPKTDSVNNLRYLARVLDRHLGFPGLDHREISKAFLEAADELERLRSEVAGYQRWASSVNDALNSGDGSYRP